MNDSKKKERENKYNEERSSSKLDIWSFIIVGIICIALGSHIHTVISFAGLLCIFIAIYLMSDYKGRYSFGSGERISLPNIFGDNWTPATTHVREVESAFRRAGFKNIESIDLEDGGKTSIFFEPGRVSSIKINGIEMDGNHKEAPKDAKIVITYHSLSPRNR